jgi:hypothetical protein
MRVSKALNTPRIPSDHVAPALAQQRLGPLERRAQDPVVNVVAVAPATGGGREHEGVGPVVRMPAPPRGDHIEQHPVHRHVSRDAAVRR